MANRKPVSRRIKESVLQKASSKNQVKPAKVSKTIAIQYSVRPFSDPNAPGNMREIIVVTDSSLAKKRSRVVKKAPVQRILKLQKEPIAFKADSPMGPALSGITRSDMVVISAHDVAFGIHAYKENE